jgi:hypothetical protein
MKWNGYVAFLNHVDRWTLMVIRFWACSLLILFQNTCLLVLGILGVTPKVPNHLPLNSRCLNKKSNWIRVVHLKRIKWTRALAWSVLNFSLSCSNETWNSLRQVLRLTHVASFLDTSNSTLTTTVGSDRKSLNLINNSDSWDFFI